MSFCTCGSEIDKNEEEILKIQEFSRYLVWYKVHKFLSSVSYLHTPPENFPEVLQKRPKIHVFLGQNP